MIATVYALRPATAAEREDLVAPSWRTLVKLPTDGRDEDARQLMVSVGHCTFGRDWLRQTLNDAVAAALYETDNRPACSVLVADHPDAPGLPLGWVAFDTEPRQVLALHVQHNARKAWVGRTLLRAVLEQHGADAPCALMTASGRRLLGHVRAAMGKVAA